MMKSEPSMRSFLVSVFLLGMTAVSPAATNWTVTGWNNLGMHCLDSDYSVFSILPPYNTINAQIIMATNGIAWIVTNNAAYAVTYHAVADADSSINKSSIGKDNFWAYVNPLFGASPLPDAGLAVQWPTSFSMPGVSNTPQAMGYEHNQNWFVAYGIPIMAYDDAGKPNQYPMMRLTAKTTGGTALATADIVLPVSDEMDCKRCHLSNTLADPKDPRVAAKPAAGWFFNPHQGSDYRLNILRLHDERQATNSVYAAALAARGFSPAGLFATVTLSNRTILCASCHLSEALPGSGSAGIPPLTAAVHGHHANVIDPRNGLTLDASGNRMACYSCHPGSVTRCLRGAMGKAVAADGSMEMQCQSCHGTMSTVGSTNRVGWLNEPTCQACHTGDAVSNSGQIRFTSVFTNGVMRVPSNQRFATSPNAPAAGLSLYRFSRGGHGGLACSACHGSTHAEFPTAFRNDNVMSQTLQGHSGMLVECNTCHGSMPNSRDGGPHGLHHLGQTWVTGADPVPHASAFNANKKACQACHGIDYRGTVLSRAQNNRVLNSGDFGTRSFWRGQQIGCYDCHNGTVDHGNAGPASPSAANVSATTSAGVPCSMVLSGAGAVGWRIVSQPTSGTIGLSNTIATYYPGEGFSGTDRFTFAANSGFRDSNLATGTVVAVALDSVGDGIPDWWRALHFGGDGRTTNSLSAALADPDNDGLPNVNEFKAGTDPLDYRSMVSMIAIKATGANIGVVFQSALGQRFQIEKRDQLTSGGWSILSSNIWGKTDETSVIDSNAMGRPYRFYRIIATP
ncbi:MAG: hypothetical protein WCL49_03215 [bacterium]